MSTQCQDSSADTYAALWLADSLARAGRGTAAAAQYRWVAETLVRRDQLHSALAAQELALSLEPHCLRTQRAVACLQRDLGWSAPAAASFERVGRACMAVGRLGEAISAYSEVVELDPTAVPQRVQLAEIYVQAGMRDAAVGHFERAARQLFDQGRTEEFLWVAHRTLTVQPAHRAVRRDLIRVLLHLRRVVDASGHIRALLHAHPGDPVGLELLAEAFAMTSRFEQASRVALLLARQLRAEGVHAFDEAMRVLRQAARWNPWEPAIRRAVADLQEAIDEVSRTDFEEDGSTGTIGFVSDAELLGHAPDTEEATTNVRELCPRSRSMQPVHDDPSGRVIYGRFGT